MATVEGTAVRSAPGRVDDSLLRCQVVTPEKTVLDVRVKFVAVPLFDGEIGILPGRAPLVARLGYGELRFTGGSGSEPRLYIDGGFLQVRDNQVSLLTNRAVPVAQLTSETAQGDLDRALALTPTTPVEFQEKDRAMARARAQLRMAEQVSH
jgi:F-type H+-transporting ATPase subunit epsilon